MSEAVGWAAAGLASGLVSFARGFAVWRRLRLIQDTPTARVRSLPMGRVELRGRAQEKAELRAPLTGTPCVYYRYTVEERRGSRRKRWAVLERGDSSAWGFYLQDETGRVLVAPAGAQVDIAPDLRGSPASAGLDASRWQRSRWLGRPALRLTEWRIHAGEPVYVLGVAQERADLTHERRRRIADKLRALKSDPEALAHLDSDRDGSISAQEWEVARQLATDEVAQEGFDDRVVIAADPHGASPFYLSDRSEHALLRRHRLQVLGGVWGGALLSLACLYYLLSYLGVMGGV
jgi:hypothetical protein